MAVTTIGGGVLASIGGGNAANILQCPGQCPQPELRNAALEGREEKKEEGAHIPTQTQFNRGVLCRGFASGVAPGLWR